MLEQLRQISKTSLSESLGIPHSFNPNLTLVEAILASAIAFSRIFLGSIVFSLFGVLAWTTYAAIGNPVLRTLAMMPILLLFLAAMAILMIAITGLAKRFLPQRPI